MGQNGSKQHETCDRMKEVLQSNGSALPANQNISSPQYTTASGKCIAAVAPTMSIAQPQLHIHSTQNQLEQSRTFQNANWLLTAPTAKAVANHTARYISTNQRPVLTSAELPLHALPLETVIAILDAYNRQIRSDHAQNDAIFLQGSQHQRCFQAPQVFSSIFNQPENIPEAEVLSHLPESAQTTPASSASPSPRITTPKLANSTDIKIEASTSAEDDESRLPKKKRRLPPSVLALADSQQPKRSRRNDEEVSRPSSENIASSSGTSNASYQQSSSSVDIEGISRFQDSEVFMEAVRHLKRLEEEHQIQRRELIECEARLKVHSELIELQKLHLMKIIQALTGPKAPPTTTTTSTSTTAPDNPYHHLHHVTTMPWHHVTVPRDNTVDESLITRHYQSRSCHQ